MTSLRTPSPAPAPATVPLQGAASWRGFAWSRLWDPLRFVFVAMHRAGFGSAPSHWRARVAFVWSWIPRLPLLASILSDQAPSRSLRLALRERPQMIGVTLWPYIHACWTAPQRLEALTAHYSQVDRRPYLALAADESVNLAALDDLYPGLRLVLDRAPWFIREGELVLNLFVAERRVFSVAFALSEVDGRPAVLLGCLQGIRDPHVLELYRDLTKALHGMRPRDFTFTAFRVLASVLGIERVCAIADCNRQHRSDYFGVDKGEQLDGNYDEVWMEQGGVLSTSGFYEFDSRPGRRSLEDIAAKKRAMYRRRYEFLDELEATIAAQLEQRRSMLASPGNSAQ